MHPFPPEFQKELLQYIKSTYLPSRKNPKQSPFNDKDLAFFAKGVEKLSTYFTEDRENLSKNYLNDPVLRSSYLLYFLPLNLLKVANILGGYQPSEILSGHVRVLDLGCGPGTSSLGLSYFYHLMAKQKKIKASNLDITLVDMNYHAIREARALLDIMAKSTLDPKIKIQTSSRNADFRKMSISKLLGNFKYHYILVSNVLNELGDRREKAAFVAQVMKHLDTKHGRLIIIEPALKHHSRDLQAVRDEIVVNQSLGFVHLPCLNQQICPLNIVNKRDWCHFYGDWEVPPFIKKLEKLIGNKNDWMKFSYMVLALTPRLWETKLKDYANSWRVISNPMPTKGKKEMVFCGPKGRYHLERLDKDRSATNYLFDEIRRGDLVEWKGASKEYGFDERFRLEKTSPLTVIKNR